MKMRTAITIAAATALTLGSAGFSAAQQLSGDERDRIQNSAAIIHELGATPDNDIPQTIWDKAQCVIVVPQLKKAAFLVGGEYGRGLMSCRRGSGWSSPIFMELEKGSWGFQIGAEQIDLVLLVMNERGVQRILGDKVTLGAEASATAGPVGRTAAAETDAQLSAEVLSYSRSQGLFAGVDVSGGVLKTDDRANGNLYGSGISAKDIVAGERFRTVPAAARAFTNALARGPVATSGQK